MSENSPKVGRRSSVSKPDMWYFDQLPPTARAALANANFNWSSGSMLNRWKRGLKGYKTGAQIAERVRAADASVKPFYQTSNR
jgi:uncharacterized protein YmfQ (DUF2313 family)